MLVGCMGGRLIFYHRPRDLGGPAVHWGLRIRRHIMSELQGEWVDWKSAHAGVYRRAAQVPGAGLKK